MTASCFSTSLPVQLSAQALAQPVSLPRLRAGQLVAPAVLVAVLAVLLLAPEQPQAQADICQRHNSAAACRVW